MTLRTALRRRAANRRVRLVFPEAQDPRVRDAAQQLEQLGIATPLLFDNQASWHDHVARDQVHELVRRRYPNLKADAIGPLRFAAGLVALGLADGCVAGASMATADVIRAALSMIGVAGGHRAISAAMYLGLGTRVLTFTDVAVVPSPSIDQLAESALAAARDRAALIGDEPIVAFLSYSTRASAGGVTVERMRAAAQRLHDLAPGVVADGELQLDAALVPEIAKQKSPDSPVGGRANILVFPSLDAANIGYKLVERLAGATAAGPLLQGLARPMSDLSRGARVDDIVDVSAMVALQAAALATLPRI